MEPHRTPRPNGVFPGLGKLNFDCSSHNTVPYANSYGQLPAYEYNTCPSTGGEMFYGSPYIQEHAVVKAPSWSVPVAPRVHINPNYRPKVSSRFQPQVSNRPASVHINPHWRGRVESTFLIAENSQGEGHSSQTAGKKTIFVNPKVLSRLNLKQSPHQIETRSASSVHFNYSLAENASLHVPPLPDEATKTQRTEMQEKTVEVPQKPELAKCATEPSYVVLNSRKLVRKSNTGQYHKHLSMEGNKSPIACSSTVKLARQVASKYKLVRSSPTVPNILKNVNSVPTSYSRRSRRKSVNLRLSSSTNSKSVYKFIRKTEDSVPLTDQSVKVGKKFDQLIVSPNPSTQRESSNRSLKSRYKLIKAQPSNLKEHAASVENVKVKAVHSRYKLVRDGVLESKSSFRNSSMCSFSLYSSPMRSKFRSFNGSRPSYERKVSRFRINQTYTAKSGTQALTTRSKTHCRSDYSRSRILKSGLYKNISWQKETIKPITHLKAHDPTVRSSKNSGQRNCITPSSKKVPNKSLVNIGGVLYRSTRTTLTRTCTGKAKERILHIRGRKFVMDGKGKTIRPASHIEDGSSTSKGGQLFARVDIGGVTFTRRNDNTLVRTNTHYARNILSLAKMRSIALLTDKHRKNNQPCLIYHRFGKCLSHIAGKCWRVHDPRNIAICRKFLQGICESEKCLLSHDVGPEKMPTCRYFLEGCCVRDNCPYLHVKLSASAAICRQFLHGYCDAGDMCKKRHVFLCPEFEKDGKCSKGKYCPYPHVNSTKQKLKRKRSTVTKHLKDSRDKMNENSGKVNAVDKTSSLRENEKVKRYYDESSPCETSNKVHLLEDSQSETLCHSDDGINAENGKFQKKATIGILPAYIPL